MKNLLKQLIIYKDFHQTLLWKIGDIIHDFKNENKSSEMVYEINLWLGEFLKLTNKYGFEGDLWKSYITYILINEENSFSLSCERIKVDEGSIIEFAKKDFDIIKKLYEYDFSDLEEELNINCFTIIKNYKTINSKKKSYNKELSSKVEDLKKELTEAKTSGEFFDSMIDYYKRSGVGSLGINKGFRIETIKHKVKIKPITNIHHSSLDDLVGLEIQKKKLVDNTEAFIDGKKANNVLLFGDSGTGKSTSVMAMLNKYYDQGLRVIEVYKHQFQDLAKLISELKHRNYKFIIYMDDLSFEEFEIEYKYLKAVIEGGLESKPQNVIIYATSNRRNIIRETWSDRTDMERAGDIHRSDTMEEKLSLVERFGVTINFSSPNLKEYHTIVETLAKPHNYMGLTKEELLKQANQWELFHGGRSGRAAQQFIDYLLGQSKKKGVKDE